MGVSKKGGGEQTIPLTAEERRARVARVRALDRDLERVENALRTAQAMLPGLVRDVEQARKVIADNTAPGSADEDDGEASAE